MRYFTKTNIFLAIFLIIIILKITILFWSQRLVSNPISSHADMRIEGFISYCIVVWQRIWYPIPSYIFSANRHRVRTIEKLKMRAASTSIASDVVSIDLLTFIRGFDTSFCIAKMWILLISQFNKGPVDRHPINIGSIKDNVVYLAGCFQYPNFSLRAAMPIKSMLS